MTTARKGVDSHAGDPRFRRRARAGRWPGGRASDGQAIYREQCRNCHAATSKPTQRALSQYKKIPTLDAAFLGPRSQDSIIAVLNHGLGKDMKSFKDKLSADEIAAVARWVKETFGAPAK